MRFTERPSIEPLFKETRVVLHIDNRYRGDIIKQIEKISELNKDYGLEIKKKRTEGETTAQGYIWSMINKIADKRNMAPEAVYKDFVKKNINSVIVYFTSMGEAKRAKAEWEERGLGYTVLQMIDYKEYVKCERIRGYTGWNFQETENFIQVLEKECNSLNIKLED